MATSSGTATVALPTDEQILITREFDAPPHLVFEAWTQAEQVDASPEDLTRQALLPSGFYPVANPYFCIRE